MKRIIASAVLAATSFTASAWGPTEQGILTGVAGYWIFQQLDKAGKPQPPQTVYIPQPVQAQPPAMQLPQPQGQIQQQQYCETKPIQDQFGTWRYVSYCYIR